MIAIVDAKLEKKLSQEADFILASEAANAGKIVLSHADLATKEQIEGTIRHLQQAMENIQCSRRLTEDEIIAGNMEALTDAQLQELSGCDMFLPAIAKWIWKIIWDSILCIL